jgi:hypothetical protein
MLAWRLSLARALSWSLLVLIPVDDVSQAVQSDRLCLQHTPG